LPLLPLLPPVLLELSFWPAQQRRRNRIAAAPAHAKVRAPPILHSLRLLFFVFFLVVLSSSFAHGWFCMRVRSGGDLFLGLVHLPMLLVFALLLFLQKL
jgi:hypothetical protein